MHHMCHHMPITQPFTCRRMTDGSMSIICLLVPEGHMYVIHYVRVHKSSIDSSVTARRCRLYNLYMMNHMADRRLVDKYRSLVRRHICEFSVPSRDAICALTRDSIE